MKRTIFTIGVIGVILIIGLVMLSPRNEKEAKEDKGRIQMFSDEKANDKANDKANYNQDIMNNMLKHIGFAEEALGKFEPKDANNVAELWGEGMVSGNGVLQYALMDEKLKLEFKAHLEKKKNISWDTRSEEKKIIDYEIVEKIEVSDKINLYKVKFNYTNELGDAGEAINTLTIADENGRWVISTIR